MPSNRNFGITFFCVFIILSILFRESNLIIFFLVLSVVFLILGALNSVLLYPLNYIWYKFGVCLSKIMSPVFLFIVFYGVFFPYSLIYKIFKKKSVFVNYKIFFSNKNFKNTHWIKYDKKNNNENFKEQF